jgi:glycosyltransferase involved in cell wall biosynthesis
MKQAKKLGVEDKIKIFGQVDDITVSKILAEAIALVFPSLYEGFGLPPFEAALLGTPSICSRKPAMTELLEDACIFCDADKPTLWAEAIKEYWRNEALRNDITIKAQRIAKQLTWKKSAEQYLAVLSMMGKT